MTCFDRDRSYKWIKIYPYGGRIEKDKLVLDLGIFLAIQRLITYPEDG